MIVPPSIAIYAAQKWVKVVVILAVVAGIWFSGYHQGVKVTKADWDKEIAVQTQERLAAEQAARKEEQRRVQEAQAVIDGATQREAASRARAVAAERAAVGLRDTIAMLNSRPAPSNPEAAGYADEARRSRELLGTCSTEYTGVAAQADELRDQVTGLQDWVSHVVQ